MATRFWVGGTGTWDASTTTHWAASSGGAGGQSVPVSVDTVTFDGSSGGGTVTVNTNPSIISITMGAFTGTLDFSANNNSATFNGGSAIFSVTGTGTRTLNLGSGTFTFPAGSSSTFDFTTTTGLTFNGGTASIVINGAPSSTRTLVLPPTAVGTLNSVTVNSNTNGFQQLRLSGAGTITTLNINGPCYVDFTFGVTYTITNLNVTGSSSGLVYLTSNAAGSVATLNVTTLTGTFGAFRMLTFGSAVTSNNSFDLGGNTNLTVTAPSGSARMIGG